MRVFVPAGSSADSSYLLYKILSETDHDVVSRIYFSEANERQMNQYNLVCDWLAKNVRQFDYLYGSYELPGVTSTTESILATANHMAHKNKCDMICMGYNLHNYTFTNWFYQSDNNLDSFYDGEFKQYTLFQQDILSSKYGKIKVDWPFMNDKKNRESALGRWQIWELLPEGLRSLVSFGCSSHEYRSLQVEDTCKTCSVCLQYVWYDNMKSKGYTGKQMDDLIMKYGDYGKYFHPDKAPNMKIYGMHNRYNAYLTK